MKIISSACTDVGKARSNNEDAFAICPDLTAGRWDQQTDYVPLGEWGLLSVVADGMGGPEAGEIASTIAIEAVRRSFSVEQLKPVLGQNQEDIPGFLKTVFKRANDAIMQHVLANPDAIGMGTTLEVLWVIHGTAYIAWAGDSRCYVFNTDKGCLSRITKDHSYVQELVDRGELNTEDMMSHPDSNIITRGLGDIDVLYEPEIAVYPVTPGEIFLLCSEGLCGYCTDKEIEKVICKKLDSIPECCQALIDLALDAGGEDNITVSLVSTLQDNEVRHKSSWRIKIKKLF